MDMTDDKDLLLQQFFSEAAQQQIADDGFTERVMQHLSQDVTQQASVTAQAVQTAAAMRRFSRLWTVACIAVFAALFVVFRGWELLAIQLEVMVRTMAVESLNINPLMLAVILFGLLCAGVSELMTSRRLWF